MRQTDTLVKHFILANYFPGLVWLLGGVVDAGGTAVGSVGIAFGSTVFFICSSILERPETVPRGIEAVATTHRIRIVAASVQVDFSRKPAVLRIPIDWPADVKLAASPPPFEFCTSTINTCKMHAIITNRSEERRVGKECRS